MAVAAAAGRADRDEDGAGAPHGLGDVGFEGQPPGFGIGRDHLLQAGLEDGNFAGPQPFDLGRILVDTDHLMAEFGQAGAGNQADIAGADHRNAHGNLLEGPPLLTGKVLIFKDKRGITESDGR